jgi:hypothetical protein
MATKKAKAKMGRPLMAPSERRDILIRVLVNEAEHDELAADAKTTGVSLSTAVRLSALATARARRGAK